MYTMKDELLAELADLKAQGLYKVEVPLASAQSAQIDVQGRRVVNLCANNYLGLADDPRLVTAAKQGLDRWGFGMASVRFICGTQDLHTELEARITSFLRGPGRLPWMSGEPSCTAPASTPMAGSSRSCAASRTRSSPTS